MNAVEELMAQRDAVLFGEWVRNVPTQDGQACLVAVGVNGVMRCQLTLGFNALGDALDNLHPGWKDGVPNSDFALPSDWNDRLCPDKQAALDVLDEAIRLAKEDM